MAPSLIYITSVILLLAGTSHAEMQCVGGPVNDNLRTCDQADIAFLLDSSGSVNSTNWVRTLDFVQDVIGALKVNEEETHVAVISYSNRADHFLLFNSTLSVPEMQDVIDIIPWKDQETNTSGAIKYALDFVFTTEAGSRRTVPRMIVLITDGGSNRDQNLTIPYAEQAKRAGILMIVVAVHSDELNYTELYAIASGDEFVMNATSYSALSSEIKSRIVTVACDVPVACDTEADITFILDASGSVRQHNFDKMKDFVKCMVNELNIGLQRVAMETFSNMASVEFGLDAYDSRYYIYQAIDDVPYERGTTNTAEALRVLREEVYQRNLGDREGVRNVVVLFTDGGSNDFPETLRQAALVRESNITLIVVAVSGWLNLIEIREIASDPDIANVFLVKDFNDIVTITAGLKGILCNALNECEPNPCVNGGTCLDGDNTYHCVCPPSWAGINCEVYCPMPADIIIAIDESGSVGQENFYVTLDFIKQFIDSLNLNQARVGMETFATEATTRFYLDEFHDVVELLNAVSFTYSAGTTNTAGAISNMRLMFNPDLGDRPDVPDHFVLVTDGVSNDPNATWYEALAARSEGIYISAVAVHLTSVAGLLELQGIASDPDDMNVMHVNDFEDLQSINRQLLEGVCMTAQPCSSNPCQGGGTCINKLNTYVCKCPYGRTGINCERYCDGEADIVFVVDGSGSIRENRFETVRQYMISVISELEVAEDRVRVGVVLYSDNAHIEFKMNTYKTKEDVIQAIRRMEWIRGKTNTVAGLDAMMGMYTEENGDRLMTFNFAIVITDGESNINQGETIPTAIASRIQGIHIIVVTVTVTPNLEIKGIASDPDEANIFFVESFSMLPTLTDALVNGMCDSVNECDSNPCLNGGICLDGLSQYMCFCQDEFTGVNCERKCGRRMDVVFALDTSGSVEETFELTLRLTRLIVQGLNFAGGRTRVGILTYSDDPKLRFHLNQYSDKQSVLNAIAFIQDRGRTNTADAIDYVVRNMFTTFNGDRPGDDDYLIVITDGRSNINNQRTVPAAERARSADIAVVAVGIGENGHVDRAELNGIANNPDNQYAFVMQYEYELEQTANSILDGFCQDFVF